MGDLPGLLSDLFIRDEDLDDPDFDDTASAHDRAREPLGSDDEDDCYSDGTSPARESPCRNRTRAYRKFHASRPGSLAASTRAIFAYMRQHQVDLPLLLWATSYNLPELVNDEVVKFERVALLTSYELPSLLTTWHRPPRGHSRGVRSKGAAHTLDNFALGRVVEMSRREMTSVGTYMRSLPSDISAESLLSLRIPELKEKVKARAPVLWSLLRQCSWTPRQEKRNILKDPDATVLFMISMASFTRSNRNSPLQRLMAIYLKSCGTSAKAFDTLSAVGLSMSQGWTYQALDQLSRSEHISMRKDIAEFPMFGSHDNVNFKFRVFEQRSDHHSHFDSGTAGTIFVIKDPEAVAPSAALLRAHRALPRVKSLIGPAEVLALEARAAPRLATRAVDNILRALLDSPDFDLATYSYRDDPLLQPAPRPGQLSLDKQPCVQQYVLDTVHMEEASYDGNDRVMREWLRQLRLDTLEEQKRTALERVVIWIGDQLTATRMRGLLRFRCDDYNTFERFDWLIPSFGWFHLMFAFEHSLHAQYYGTRTGLGLVHAFEVLDRRGLHTTSTQGTFHHTFEEALDHTLQAHLRALWCHVGGVDSLADLRARSPQELYDLATRIHHEHASTQALLRMETTSAGLPTKPLDPLPRQMTQFVRDVLDYTILRDAISCGDVQTMEDSLPRLFFRFSGGNNPNYSIEVCELLQNLNIDWPEDLKTFMRKYCWVTNTSGHAGSWIAIDRAQEHNVCAVKSTYGTAGPFATWDYLGRTSASIPAQRRVKDHVESEINRGYRGKSHTTPEAERDIIKLQSTYHAAGIYAQKTSRGKMDSRDRFTDIMKQGTEAVLSGKAFKRWAQGRVAERQVSDENWDEQDAPPGTTS